MDFEHVLVAGAGQMGAGIAQVVAGSGRRVSLYDAAPGATERGLAAMRKSLEKLAEKGGSDPDEVLARVTAVEDIVPADLLIEAVIEDAAVKEDLFRRADEVLPESAVLASNTSSIPITSLAAVTGRPERVIGMHFFNPVPVLKLVEVIRAVQTSDETATAITKLAEELGKVPAQANDFPGFVSNRILMPFINEAAYALMEGVAEPEAIDTIAKLGFAHPMGPLALARPDRPRHLRRDHGGPPRRARQPEVRAVPAAAAVRSGRAARPQVGPGLLLVLVSGELRAWLDAGNGSDEDFVDTVFALVLRREPEPDARERALAKLKEGTLSRATLVHELSGAPEFERIRLLDDGIAFARGARERGERPRWLQGPAGTDERVVEVPWVLSRLTGERALEVGYAFAEPPYLAALLRAGFAELTGVDLAEADVPGLTGVQADVRDLPFDDQAFDLVLCVSTLEHVGADNSGYGLDAEDDGASRLTALRELRRVLTRAGRLLITVPCGEPGDYGWFHQDDVRGWTRLFTRAGFFVEEQEVYELTEEGWRASPELVTAGLRYGERGPAASAVLCAELSPRRLRRLLTPDGIERTARRRAPAPLRRLRRLPRTG